MILLPPLRGQFYRQEAVMAIHRRKTRKTKKIRMMNPLTPRWGKLRTNSLRTWTMPGWASSTSRRPRMEKPW